MAEAITARDINPARVGNVDNRVDNGGMTNDTLQHPHRDRWAAWLDAHRTVRPRNAPASTADRVLQVRAAVIVDRQLEWNAHREIARRAGGGIRGEQIAREALGGGFRTASANLLGHIVR